MAPFEGDESLLGFAGAPDVRVRCAASMPIQRIELIWIETHADVPVRLSQLGMPWSVSVR